jgi:hypothetical protein
MQVAETFAMTIPKDDLTENAALKDLLSLHQQQQQQQQPGSKSKKRHSGDTKAAASVHSKTTTTSNGAENAIVAGSEAFSLGSFAQLDTCVTVVDASRFYDDLHSIEELKDRWVEGIG